MASKSQEKRVKVQAGKTYQLNEQEAKVVKAIRKLTTAAKARVAFDDAKDEFELVMYDVSSNLDRDFF